jgi:hypothetical protein
VDRKLEFSREAPLRLASRRYGARPSSVIIAAGGKCDRQKRHDSSRRDGIQRTAFRRAGPFMHKVIHRCA